MSGFEEEGPSEIKGLMIKLKLERDVAEEKYEDEEEKEQRDSVEEAESSEFEEEEEEEEDVDDEEDRRMSKSHWYDYLAEGETKVDWKKWDQYDEEIKATEGYGLTVDVGLCEMAALRPVLNFKKRYDFFCGLSDLAIQKFNQDNSGKEFKVVDVEWVVNGSGRGVIYLLTFKAEDAEEGVKTFEATVLDGIMDEEPEVFQCRMKKQIDA